MQFFNKNQNESSSHDAQGLFLTTRQLSLTISGMILIGFFIFMAGYFLGQKKALQQFSNKLELDSFSDKIYSSLYALYDSKGVPEEEDAEGSSSDVEELGSLEQSSVKVAEGTKNAPEGHQEAGVPVNAAVASIPTPSQNNEQKHFYAHLAGFGSSSAAYAFANRLNKHTTMVHVKKHVSKSSKGNERSWYQVTTKPFATKESIVAFIDRVKREEHLKDVRLISC